MLQRYHICQFGTGEHTQKARPVNVLTDSQGNLEAKENLEQPITGQIIIHICMNEMYNNKYIL